MTTTYDGVSMGFELETQLLCLVISKRGGKRFTLPSDYTKHAFLQNSVEVYNDAFSPSTIFAKTLALPYLSEEEDSAAVVGGGGFVLENIKEAGFNNNEFVITFARKQSIGAESFFRTVLTQYLKAVDKMVAVLENYTPVALPPDFPYRSLLVSKAKDPRYSKVGFLAQATPDAFAIEDLTFYYQCTIGFMLKDAIPIMTDLAARYYEIKGLSMSNPVLDLASRVRGAIANVKLASYLFLFLYSAATRHSRKVGTLFIIRHAFQDVRVVLEPDELARLDTWMRKHGSTDEYAYFRSIHFEPVPDTQQEKFRKQSVWDVGRIPFKRSESRVFVEFRGFQSVLNHLVGTGPKSIRRVREALVVI